MAETVLETIPEYAPIITSDIDNDISFKSIEVDYARLCLGAIHAGVPPERLSDVSIHFNDPLAHHHTIGSAFDNTARVQTPITWRITEARLRREGFAAHQQNFNYAISVNPEGTETLKSLIRWGMRRSLGKPAPDNIDQLSTDDIVGLILGHEIRHVTQFTKVEDPQAETEKRRRAALWQLALYETVCIDVATGGIMDKPLLPGSPYVIPTAFILGVAITKARYLFKGGYYSKPEEVDCNQYVYDCLQMGDDNPWLGVIKTSIRKYDEQRSTPMSFDVKS